MTLIAILLLTLAADKKQYAQTTISGKLSHPETGEPLVDARLTFTPIDPDAPVVETSSGQDGQFEAPGLGFGLYVLEIETSEGEMLRGVKSVPVQDGAPVEIMLQRSDKIRSATSVEIQPDLFAAMVDVEKMDWARFWKQFGIFFGLAIVTGLAVF